MQTMQKTVRKSLCTKPSALAATPALLTVAVATGWAGWGGASAVRADTLVTYELAGQPGTQTTSPATFTASGVTGVAISRGPGLRPNEANNSINSSGWNDLSPNDFYLFGFNVNPGSSAVVDSLTLATRSSGTGPGFVNVLYTVNGGPETLITTLVQPGTNFVNSVLTFSPISVSSSFRFLLRSANSTSANGGTIGSTGTFRISDYSPNNGATFQPVTISGRITTTATPVVPEPSEWLAMGMAGTSVMGLMIRARSRRRKSSRTSRTSETAA